MHAAGDLEAVLRAVAAELREDIPQAVERGLARMREEAAEFFVRDEDPDFVELYRRSYLEQLRFVYSGLENGRDLEDQQPPGLVAEEARLTANLGINLSALLLTYRVGHRLLLEDTISCVEKRVSDPDLRASVLRVSSRWFFAYSDWLTVRSTETYERERGLLVRDRDQRRRRLVRDLLDGEPVDTGQLGYEIDADHLAVVAWGHEPQRALLMLRDTTRLALLSVSGTDTTAWGWLGASAIDDRALCAIRELQPPEGTRISLGAPCREIAGFCLTHRQAWNAYRIARRTTEPVTWHADVALLALTLQDIDLAREFVMRELGPLSANDERSDLLRETLTAYFATGQNAASAARRLGVHNRTVLYRIRSIEQRLGHSVDARREELAVALRLAPVVLGDRDRSDRPARARVTTPRATTPTSRQTRPP